MPFREHQLRIAGLAFSLALPAVAELRAQVVAPSGRTLFSQNVMLRCTARFDAFEELQRVRMHEFQLPCAVNWGIRPATNLIAVLPFQLRRQEVVEGPPDRSDTQAGAGDALFLVQYDGFYQKNVPRGTTRLGAQIGIRLPTGSNGFSLGAAGYFATGIFSWVRDRNWVITDLQYSWSGRNSRGFKQGARWGYDLAYLYRLLPLEGFRGDNLFLVLELNGQSAARNRSGEADLADSGGELLFLSPGLEYLPSRRLVLEFSMPMPVYRELNGSQPQPRLSWIVGFRLLF